MMYFFENGLFMYNDTYYNIQRINMDWIKINYKRKKIQSCIYYNTERILDEYVVIDGVGIYVSNLVKV